MDQIQRLGLTYNPKRPSYNEIVEYFKGVLCIRHGVDYIVPEYDYSDFIIMSEDEISIDFGGIIEIWNNKSGFEYITQFFVV